MELTPRQRRLEHIARVHGTFGLARADHGMELINEQDHLPFFLAELVQHRLEAFLEVAAVLRPGQERTQIQRQDALILQAIGHFAVHNALRQALDDRGLAHTGLTDQNRVVLLATLQYLDGPPDLIIPADHRIQLAIPGPGGEIRGILVQCLTVFLCRGVVHGLTSTHAVDGLGH